jgi:peptide/nickel transport system permease protein
MDQLFLVLRRLAIAVPMVFVVSVLIFGVTYLVPGDAASTLAGETASAEDVERIRNELGLDRPFLAQLGDWFADLARGDLGASLTDGQEVTTIIGDRLPVTLSLALAAMAVALAIGLPLGIVAATNINTWRDRAAVVFASIGLALPNYWFGLLLVIVFAVQLGWFPVTGYVPLTEDPVEWLRHIALPAVALGAAAAAEVARQTRAALSRTLDMDYVRTARMKGLPRRAIVGRHALKNAAGPIVTSFGLQATVLLGGTVIMERVFSIPGLGSAALDAVSSRNLPVVQGIALVTTVIAITTNIVMDLANAYLNPKLRTA